MSPCGWTREELVELRRRSRLLAPCWSLEGLARQVGRGTQEVNRAVDALLGRSAADAATHLDAQLGGTDRVRRFVAGLLR